MSWINRLLGSLRKNKLEDQLDEELKFHIEMRTREFIASGMTPEEARHKAARLFGNQLLLKERSRDMDTIGWIESLRHPGPRPSDCPLAALNSCGVRFIATSQSLDTDQSNPTSRLLLQILASVAEFEREMIRERTLIGLRVAKANGKHV